MATTGSGLAFGVGRVSPCENLCILPQRVGSVVWPDGEDGRETELQLLASHCLKGDLEVERTDGDDGVPLPWVYKSFLNNIDVFYATSSDDKVGIGVRNVVTHDIKPVENMRAIEVCRQQ